MIWIDDGKLGMRVLERSRRRALAEVVHVRDKGARLAPQGRQLAQRCMWTCQR
ncbi:MAG: hypothetical protein R3E48_18660 [Burkholderiaceae bacterium]